MRVLYLYSGPRKEKFAGDCYPDTQFYGLNHMKALGIDAEYKEFRDLIDSRFIERLLPFNLRHAFLYLFARKYDVVFGASILPSLFLKKIFGGKTKFVLFNISLGRSIRSYQKSSFKMKILKSLLRECSAIVSLSNYQSEYLAEHLPELKDKLHVVPLGVDTNYYKYTDSSKRGELILSGGRDNGRDYKTLIEVARKLPNEKFFIFCSRRNMEGISDIPDNVEVQYDVPYEEIQEKYYPSAKFLLLTTHSDDYTHGADCSGQTVLLEAMASGMPVVISRKRCLEDYVEQGVEGELVDFYDVSGIVEVIARMSPEKRAKHGQSARSRVEKEFTTKEMAGNLARIFKTLS